MNQGNVAFKGICYRCMFGEHNHCFGTDGKCVCHYHKHDLEFVMDQINTGLMRAGLRPMGPPSRFPEDPAPGERFYFSVSVRRHD